jgi:beta-mannosidase
MGTDPNDNVLTRKVLPEVVRAESHGVPFLPSSPYIDEAAYNNGDFLPTPERHLWGPRNYYKSEFYTKFEAHFASEMGYHGCPSVSSLKKFLSPGKLWPYQDNEEWLLHCTSPVPGVDLYDYRVELMATQIRCVFGSVPDNLEEYVFASQAVQLEAVKFFVESFRLWKWRRTGIIWWNLLDGWPELSDAVVDYYFDKKLAYHAIKRSQSPLLVGVREPQDGEQTAVAVNDTREAVTITYAVTDIDTGAAVLSGTAEVPGDSVVELGRIGYDGSAQRFYAITWSSELGEGASHYLAGAPNFDLARYRGWLAKAGYEVG